MVALEHGNYDEAKNHLVESLTLLHELGERWQTAHTLEVFASLAAGQENPNLLRAAWLFGAAEVFRETLSARYCHFSGILTSTALPASGHNSTRRLLQ